MRIEQLEYLIELSKWGSMTLVAEHFFLTRQAISSSIRQLEEELGYQILNRSNSEITFTKAGEEVLAFALQIVQQKNELETKLQLTIENTTEKKQQWRIDSVTAIANDAIPKVIHTMLRSGTDDVFNFNMTDIDTLMERLKNNECDMGIVTLNPDELKRRLAYLGTEKFHYHILAEDCFIFCINKKYHQGTNTVMQVDRMSQYKKGVYSALLDIKYVETPAIDTSAKSILLSYSNDADFHRHMLQYENYGVLMPRLVFEKFFDQKKYDMLTIDVVPTKLQHVVFYSKDHYERIKIFLNYLEKFIV